MATVLKSARGIPEPDFPIPPGVVLADEARTARRRFYPVTILFTTYAALVVALAFRAHPGRTLAGLALGGASWTLLEYLVHRHVLHGVFPDGAGPLRHRLHVLFDPMHGDHHLRPWDGMYINGHAAAVPFAAVLALLSFLGPWAFGPVFVAALLQSYVVEEWVHYASHFCRLRSRYFVYLRRRHWRHHARGGSETAFGLTSGIWDALCGTDLNARSPRSLPAAAARTRGPRASAPGAAAAPRRAARAAPGA